MSCFEITPCPVRPIYTWEDIPVLYTEAQLPHWTGKGGKHFNRYYLACERTFERYCTQELYPQAESACRQAVESAGALPQWHASLLPTITQETPDLLSLYIDTAETDGIHRTVLRRGDTWDLRRGLPAALSDFFPAHTPWRRRLLELAAQEIEAQETQGIALYHEDWRRKLHSAFHSHHFYLTEKGLCFFYQMYAIAPAVEGTPTFCLPYDPEQGPFPTLP